MSLVIASSPGDLFLFILFMASRISSGVNSLSSSVFIVSLIWDLISLWRSLSVSSSSSGVKESIMKRIVSAVSVVTVRQAFLGLRVSYSF